MPPTFNDVLLDVCDSLTEILDEECTSEAGEQLVTQTWKTVSVPHLVRVVVDRSVFRNREWWAGPECNRRHLELGESPRLPNLFYAARITSLRRLPNHEVEVVFSVETHG